MEKQLLIYENATPISLVEHKELSIDISNGFKFSKGLIAVPLTAIEFAKAVHEYVIVFAGIDNDSMMAFAIVGAEEGDNLYLNDDGSFSADYIPAFIRRYPFVFSMGEEQLTLCVDSAYEGCNYEGKGKKLFDENNEHTEYLKQIVEFMTQYQGQYNLTTAFAKKIAELGLLDPLTAQIKPAEGDSISLTGFFGVNKDKLKVLSPDQLTDLIKSDFLELLYMQLLSMNNFDELLKRMRR